MIDKPRPSSQTGMTLIEITLVLVILMALAALVIPYVGGYHDKLGHSVNADDLVELNKAIFRYETELAKYPNGMDSLLTADESMYPYLVNDKLFTPVTLTQNEAKSLSDIGIGYIAQMRDQTNEPTFNANDGLIHTIMDGVKVAIIQCDRLQADETCQDGEWSSGGDAQNVRGRLLLGGNIDTQNYYYVVFGVGHYNRMNGVTLYSAPIYFPTQTELASQAKYNRILAVFQVPRDGSENSGRKARFVGTLVPWTELWGLQTILANAHQNLAKSL